MANDEAVIRVVLDGDKETPASESTPARTQEEIDASFKEKMRVREQREREAHARRPDKIDDPLANVVDVLNQAVDKWEKEELPQQPEPEPPAPPEFEPGPELFPKTSGFEAYERRQKIKLREEREREAELEAKKEEAEEKKRQREEEKRLRQQERDEDYAARQELRDLKRQQQENEQRERQQDRDEDFAARQELKDLRDKQREDERKQRQQDADEDYAARQELRDLKDKQREEEKKQQQQNKDRLAEEKQAKESEAALAKAIADEERERKRKLLADEKARKQQDIDEDFAEKQAEKEEQERIKNLPQVEVLFDPYEQARKRREGEIRSAQVEQAYKDQYGERGGNKPLDDILGLVDKFRGTLGGVLGTFTGAILDTTQAFRKVAQEREKEEYKQQLLAEGRGALSSSGMQNGQQNFPTLPATVPQGRTPSQDTNVAAPVAEMANATASTGSALSAVIPVAGALTVAFVGATKVIGGLIDSINERVNRLAEYSPEIAQAQALAELRQVTNDMRRAQEGGAELARFVEEQNKMQQQFEEIKQKLLMKILPMINGIMQILNAIFGVVTRMNDNSEIVDPTSMLDDPRFTQVGAAGWVPEV